jgi:hypothetical protein
MKNKQTKEIIKDWFKKWELGDFVNLPLAEQFKHTSPFGVIKGKETYLNLVKSNKDKFLGHQFEIIDELYEDNKGCIRYKAIQGDFSLDVSEWHYIENNLIIEIVAYYHIGEIREERKLNKI